MSLRDASWLKRAGAGAVAAVLALFAFIFLMGAVNRFATPLPDGGASDWIVPAVLFLPCAAGASLLAWWLRPPLDRQLLYRPFFQAILIYAVALLAIAPFRGLAFAVCFLAFCVYCVAAPIGTLSRPWWTTALSAVLSGGLLFVALHSTAESLFGLRESESDMIYLLPLTYFPVLLGAAGIVRLVQRARAG